MMPPLVISSASLCLCSLPFPSRLWQTKTPSTKGRGLKARDHPFSPTRRRGALGHVFMPLPCYGGIRLLLLPTPILVPAPLPSKERVMVRFSGSGSGGIFAILDCAPSHQSGFAGQPMNRYSSPSSPFSLRQPIRRGKMGQEYPGSHEYAIVTLGHRPTIRRSRLRRVASPICSS